MNYKLEKCFHPMLAKRESVEIRKKIQAEMKKHDLGYLLLTGQANVFYATGYMPMLAGGAFAMVPAEGEAHLIISNLESADAWACTTDVDVREFLSWVFIDDGSERSRSDKGDIIDPAAPVKTILDIFKNIPMDGKLGVDFGRMGFRLHAALKNFLPDGAMVDGSVAVRDARIIKTPWEIEMLRLAAQQLDLVWRHVVTDLKPGMPAWMIDSLFVFYSGLLNLEHGALTRISGFVPAAGPYFGLCALPRGYILKAGDVVKFDVGFRYLFYNSDIARTFVVGGTASDEVLEVYETLYHANRLGVGMLKPGVPMRDIYKEVRADVERSRLIPKYPRGHVGHSIGCDEVPEEYPTIAPGTSHLLEPGMVVCLETPYSGTGGAPVIGGFNLEDTHVITADGSEPFTTLPDNIFWR